MRQSLVIIGNSAMGRETCAYAEDCGFFVKGFLDSRGALLDRYDNYPGTISSVEDYSPCAGDAFVCALGDAVQRRHYVEIIESKGGRFVNVVHPAAYIGKNVTLGKGCIICPNVTLSADITVGDHVIVNINSSISHDGIVGDFATISPGCHIAGWCHVGRGAFIGTGASLVPRVKLGDAGVFVAAGAVVTQSFEMGRVMGVPAVLK